MKRGFSVSDLFSPDSSRELGTPELGPSGFSGRGWEGGGAGAW